MGKKIDILKHVLVPKHEVLAEKEAEKVLEKYGIRPTQLPKIKVDDPVVKAIGAKPGDIIKITRRSETAGQAIAYRLVIEY